MLSYKESLKILKETDALLDGHFILSSGLHSSQYIQCAKLLSNPNKAKKIIKSLSLKIKKYYKSIDLILSPAMGGVIIGYEIGRLLNIETIFCERVNGNFTLRRGFNIKRNSKILIVEDVITTGKSSIECSKLVNTFKGNVVGFASIINRSNKNYLTSKKIVSQVKINIPVFNNKKIPKKLKKIEITKPGSRFITK